MAGTLYVVATPIGNLEDFTFRAVRILKEVDLIACEDTRHTRHLLDHYEIAKPTISYHDHNEAQRAEDLVERLLAGVNIALVTDAGTPLISDPGYRVVFRAAEKGIGIVSLPGANAALTALAGSGLPTDSFYFGGFLPAKQTQRQRLLEQVRAFACTLVFYEAPHRILETLADVQEVLGDREIVVCRELTKMHEEWIRDRVSGTTNQLSARPAIKGEITLIIGKQEQTATPNQTVQQSFEAHIKSGLSRMDAIKAVARERGVPKGEVYAELEQRR